MLFDEKFHCHYWIYIQEVSNIREGTWLYQSPRDFPCAICLLVIIFLMHSFAVGEHKWYQPLQHKSNGIPWIKRRDGFFLLGPGKDSQWSAHLGPWSSTCSLSKLPHTLENYCMWLVTERKHHLCIVIIGIFIYRRDRSAFFTFFQRYTTPQKGIMSFFNIIK